MNRVDTRHASVLGRVGKNLGWLAGSTGFSAAASLIYVALTARTLGPRGFGSFALVMTYGELISSLVQFQSWKAVIGFGAAHQKRGDNTRLGRLFGYTASLDWLSGIIGSTIGISGVLLVGPLLHWTPAEEFAAAWFGTALLMTSSTTPAGVLRLFNRFDLEAYTDVAAQITRLTGCFVGWVIGAGVGWFLCVWALAGLLEMILQWATVLILGHSLSFGRRALKLASEENRGLWPFMLKTNLSSSLSLIWMQCGTLVVGAWAGPVEAGGFRLANRLGQAMIKPVEMATRALFPELARLVADDDEMTMRTVLIRASCMAAVLGSLIVAAASLWGRELLTLFAGSQFLFAYNFLALMCIASAINVLGFALEPFQNAHFRPGAVLRTYLITALLYSILLLVLLPRFGAEAVALASIAAAVSCIIQLGVATARLLAKRSVNPPGLPQRLEGEAMLLGEPNEWQRS